MRTFILFIGALFFTLSALTPVKASAQTQQWTVTRAIINTVDQFPQDTATKDMKLYGNLHITNGYVQMFIRVCRPDGSYCSGNFEFIERSQITFVNDYVAYLRSGLEITILQTQPKLIISVHVPGLETDIFVLRRVK